MKKLLIAMGFLVFLGGIASAQNYRHNGYKYFNNNQTNQSQYNTNQNQQQQQRGFSNSWNNNNTYIQPYRQNAYGQGVHSDATGRPFEWKTQDGQTSHSNRVKPNGYGPGIGMDEYGRPLKPSPWGQR